MVRRLISFWDGLFSGAMLNFGRVMSMSRVQRLLKVQVAPLARCFCVFFPVRLGSALHCRWASKYQGEAPPCGASCNWKVTILERGCFLMPELCESFSYWPGFFFPSWVSLRELDTHQNYPKQKSGFIKG